MYKINDCYDFNIFNRQSNTHEIIYTHLLEWSQCHMCVIVFCMINKLKCNGHPYPKQKQNAHART